MKRLSTSQLTKDTASTDSDDDGQSDGKSQGFQRAPPEVMATRRIVKVRRTLNASSSSVAAPPTTSLSGTGSDSNNCAQGAVNSPKEPTVPFNPFSTLSALSNKKTPATNTLSTTIEPIKNNEMSKQKEVTSSKEAEDVEKTPCATEDVSTKQPTEDVCNDATQKINRPDSESEAISKVEESAKKSEVLITENDASITKSPHVPIENLGEKVPISSDPDCTSGQKENVVSKDAKSVEGNGDNVVEIKRKQHGEQDGAKKPRKDTFSSKVEKDSAAVVLDQTTINQDISVGKENTETTKPSGFAVFGGNIAFGGVDKSAMRTFAEAAKSEQGKFSFSSVASVASVANKDGVTEVDAKEQKEFREEKVETGEEEERELFRTRAKLYCLEQGDSGPRWKERGVGQLKLKEKIDDGRARLIMRTEATLRVILNCAVYSSMKLDKASERSVRFNGFEVDEKLCEETKCFLVRFSTKETSSSFVAAVEKWQDSRAGKADDKTDGNQQ